MFENWHIRRNILGIVVHVVTHPDAVQRVLQTNAVNYAKPDIVKRVIAPMIGRGLLSSDGELWREQRRIVAASFAPPAVDALIPDFAHAARERTKDWKNGAVRDLAEESTATTMGVIADTLFGGDPRLKTQAAMAHIAAALRAAAEARLSAVLRLPTFGWNRTMRAGLDGQVFLRSTLGDLVRERTGRADGDFLDRLIRSLKDRFPEDEAAALALDNAATFYLAGHETTANALTWTTYLLSEQPDLQDGAAEEAREALKGDDDPDLPDRVPLLRRIMEESIRLYRASTARRLARTRWPALPSRRATSSRSGPGSSTATRSSGTTPTPSTPIASCQSARRSFTAFNMSRSAAVRASASAPASPPPKRSPSSPTGSPPGASSAPSLGRSAS